MGAPKDILDLINRFREQYDSYRSPSYNESQLRHYAWSANRSLPILPDVEILIVEEATAR